MPLASPGRRGRKKRFGHTVTCTERMMCI
jgi:hypothetical protein